MTSQNATFGDCLDSGYSIRVYCDSISCSNGRALDLEAMVAKYGRDHGALHNDLIKLSWRCDKCGGRKVTFRYQPGTKEYDAKRPDLRPDWVDEGVPF
jgi:hypothetical protein